MIWASNAPLMSQSRPRKPANRAGRWTVVNSCNAHLAAPPAVSGGTADRAQGRESGRVADDEVVLAPNS